MTKAFQFPFEHILQYRQRLEQEARLNLAAAQNAYQTQYRQVEDLRQKVHAAEVHLKSQGELASEELWLWTTFRERLLQEIIRGELQLQQLAARVTTCRTALVQRSKETKILERLKTKQAMEYYAQQKHKEQKELDEITSLRHQYKGF
jgi:flagellar FliJ protein